MHETLADYIQRTDLRERRRANRWLRNALRKRVRAFLAWWDELGRALGVMALTVAALLPMLALAAWIAIEATS